MKTLLFVLIIFIFTGCSSHYWHTTQPVTPITYHDNNFRSPYSEGKLRRLLLMPIEHEKYEGFYWSYEEPMESLREYEQVCKKFLSEKKGYDIISLSDPNGKWQNILEVDQNPDNMKSLNTEWEKEYGNIHSQELVQKVGKVFNADGILVIRLYYKESFSSNKMAEATIYETSSGKIIYRMEITNNVATIDTLLRFFVFMDNAVPVQLTK